MKKLTLTALLSFVCLFVSAQTIEKTYTFSEPNINAIQGYEQVELKGCMQTALAGQPSLPYQSVSLMLPEGQEAQSIEVILSDFHEIEGSHMLFPYQPARTYSNPERREFVKDESIYNSKAIYPAQAEGKLSTYYMNGIGFAFSAFTPVQYEPATGRVSYATKATVIVKTTASKTDNSRKLWLTANNCYRASQLAQNPEMLQSYKGRGRTASGYELLVITKQMWLSEFDAYIDFYNARGLRTRIISLEEVLSTMDGRDNPEKIRNYIIQEYEENGIMMVNIAGDVPDMPYRGFYCSVLTGGSWETDNDIPADLYYAALDGTWNDNGDNKWGEIGEDDLLPEIGVGRMCFSTQTELHNMLHKTMTYQTEPVLGEFRKIILAGEHLYDDPLSNGSMYLELLVGQHDDNGYSTNCIPEDYTFTRLYEEEGNWSGSRLKNAINEGAQYVHHDGHANTSYVAGWYNSDITDQNFYAVNGVDHNYTFFHTSGCICGDFSSTCILERMTQISNFAVAAIGNSRYGWFNEGQTEGPSIHLHRETEDAYYNDRIPYVGLALTEGKCMTAPWVNAPGQWEENALRWNFYDLNIMGDVAACAWHDEPFTPEVDYANQILVGLESTEVNVFDANGNGLKNFRCSYFHGEQMLGTAQTDENGHATIEFFEPIDFVDEITLVVTGCNAWPQTLDAITMPGNCAYVIYQSYEIEDENNGQADFGETLSLKMDIKNVGTVNASNITVTLSTESEYVTINNNTASISTLAGGATTTLTDVFNMTISDEVPDMTSAQFLVTCTAGNETWTSKFTMRMHAPQLAVTGKSMVGSGNGVEPGETATVHFTCMNNGSAIAPGTVFAVYCSAPEVSFEQNTFHMGSVEAGAEFSNDFSFTLSSSAQIGVAYEMILAVYSGKYITYDSYVFSVGNIIEDFESGDFSKFDWSLNNYVNPWQIVTEQPYEGSYCCKSGAISNYQDVILSLVLDVQSEGDMSFYKRVSSEANYDKLKFSIDGQEKGNWSGEVDWSIETYHLTSGQHTLAWTYSKDVSVSSGSDCAWIDYIQFPPTEVVASTQEVITNGPVVYPNPAKDNVTVEANDIQSVMVYNLMGQVVRTQLCIGNNAVINVEGLNAGLYLMKVVSADGENVIKMTIGR